MNKEKLYNKIDSLLGEVSVNYNPDIAYEMRVLNEKWFRNNKPEKPKLRELHEGSEAPVQRGDKKVYCKNCKYFKDLNEGCSSYSGGQKYICSHPENKKISKLSSWLSKQNNIYYENSPSLINNNNICKLYKTKWYKFWVK
ncbi:MAG: hypothetical protein PVG65_00545 [Candidatus Thorarchaeota archaeon]|jgi:hypothetical protein